MNASIPWCVASAVVAATIAGGQLAIAQPTAEELAANPPLFLATARRALKWDEPAEPARIVGPIYFVGTKGLASYLITTPDGHFLINSGMPGSGPLIEASIRKLGFKPEDIKILLTGHAHCDHVGGHAYLQKLSGGKIGMIEQEKELFESGGKADFVYSKYKEFAFEPAPVEYVFRDGDVIKLGDVEILARLTNGHTKGSMSFVTKVFDDGETYVVAFPNGTSVNPGYRVAVNPSYEGIGDDYRRTLAIFESLQPDIWLNPHTEAFEFESKLARSATEGVRAWVDPEGYARWVREQRQRYEDAVDWEMRPR